MKQVGEKVAVQDAGGLFCCMKDSFFGERSMEMKVLEIRAQAAARGVHAGKLNKTELIRTIQRVEGNLACFNTGRAAECGQEQCLWREDCR
jgi:hypothetical protein